MISISQGAGAEKMEEMTQTSKDFNVKALLYCKRVRCFYGFREIKLPQGRFWLVGRWLQLACCNWLEVCVISYCTFGLLIGCFG